MLSGSLLMNKKEEGRQEGIMTSITQLKYSRLSTQELSSLQLQDDDSKDDEHSAEHSSEHSLSQLEGGRITNLTSTDPSIAKSEEHSLKFETSSDPVPTRSSVIGSNLPNPTIRRPPKARDFLYALLFIFHFILVSFMSGTEDFALHDSFTVWSYMVIISIVLGALAGLPLLSIYGGKLTENVLICCIPIGIFCQISFGNVLLLLQSRYSIYGIFLLLISLIETFSYKSAKDHLSFTAALLSTTDDILSTYGTSLSVTCLCVIIAQSGMLMWWGVLFVGLITKPPSEISEVLVVVMLLSYYWITKFFQTFMSFIVGGCVLWYFLQDSRSGSSSDAFNPSGRVLLHVHCALTSSIGSICKGAFIHPISDVILLLEHWAKGRNLYVTPYSCRGCSRSIISKLVPIAKYNHRLAICLVSTYGRTFSKASEELIKSHPEALDIAICDSSAYSLRAVAKSISSIILLLFTLIASRKDGASVTMFLIIIALTACSGMSLALTIYSSGIDAVIIAFFIKPDKLRLENPIVFLRFLRTTEAALR